MKLVEFSPPTLRGSFESGLILNKLWLIHELKKIKDQFSTIYVLGSWYGNMSILLAKITRLLNATHSAAINIHGLISTSACCAKRTTIKLTANLLALTNGTK